MYVRKFKISSRAVARLRKSAQFGRPGAELRHGLYQKLFRDAGPTDHPCHQPQAECKARSWDSLTAFVIAVTTRIGKHNDQRQSES
jgi:hypothetical protein